MDDATPEQARDFHRAAASFYRSAPWREATEEETIEVRCEQLAGGPRYAVVLGRKGTVKGLMLFDDRRSRSLMAGGDYEAVADRLRCLGLHFEDLGLARPQDVEAIRTHGFEVAGPNAYPVVFRMDTGRDFRSPVAWELELLEACLWVIPDFLKRAGDRKPDEYEYAFDGAIGRMTLDLAWATMRRSRGG